VDIKRIAETMPARQRRFLLGMAKVEPKIFGRLRIDTTCTSTPMRHPLSNALFPQAEEELRLIQEREKRT